AHLVGQKNRVEDAAADHGDEVVAQKKTAAPAPLQIAAEHPHAKHVEKNVEQSAVQKLVGEQLPDIKLVQHQGRHQTEIKLQPIPGGGAEQRLQDKHRGIDDQEELDRGGHRAGAEHHLPRLVLHRKSV